MIRLERVLQISVYLMAALSSLMLGMGEQVWVYVAVLWMAALAAYFYTDCWQWVLLPRILSNFLALAAGALALYEVVRGGQEYQLLGVAHFLVYLQVIIFFQKKRPREYAQIAVLSLFQVMVAAVVSLNVNFALFLVAELFLSLWVLVLLQLYRQWHFHRGRRQETLAAVFSPAVHAASPSRIGGFAHAASAGADRDFHGTRLVRFTSLLCFLSLGIAILIFPLVPRVRSAQWAGTSTVATTGLTRELQLGKNAQVQESNEEVMTVALRHNATDEAYRVPGALLLRGDVFDRYVGDGRWERAQFSVGTTLAKGFATNSIRQEVELYKNSLDVLFAVQPVDTVLHGVKGEERPIARDRKTGILLWPEKVRSQRLRYNVYSPRNGVVENYTRDLEPPQGFTETQLKALPPGLEGLKELAENRAEGVVPEPGRTDASQRRVARNFEAYLLDSNRFTYSLGLDVSEFGTPGIDPVEDFLLNHKTGYCEYFASALTLMLRNVGIPARMVAGYKGGEYNALGGYYMVLDRHAHNWVEAYVTDAQENQKWIVLDPTPADSEMRDVEFAGSWYSGIRQWINYLQHQWSRYVVDLDNSRQQKMLRDAGDHLFGSLARWRDQVEAKGTFEGLFSQSASRGFWGRVSAVVLGVLALGGISLAFWLVVRGTLGLMRRFRWGRRSAENGQTIEVEFYRRLVEVLERHQLIRPPASSHREFAHLAGRNLAMQPYTQPVAGIPGRVIESFHRVRFGHEEMAPSQEAELLTAISELEKCIERGNGDSVPEPTSKE